MGPVRLAIESATDSLSVAAGRSDGEAVIAVVSGARQHATAMLRLIEDVLRPLRAGPADLGLVVVSDGPGSFTGLRVGITVAKALALGTGIPLWTASTLLVRAAGVWQPGESVLSVAPALRGEVYAGAWQHGSDGLVTEVMAPRTVGPGDRGVLPMVGRLVGEGPEELLAELAQRTGGAALTGAITQPRADVLLQLLDRQGGARQIEDISTWEPLYGRPAEAQAKWERDHGRPLPDSTDHTR